MNFLTTESKNFFITISLLIVCLFSACAREEGARRATAFDVFGITEENPDKNTSEIFLTDDVQWERKTDSLSEPERKISDLDGSEITISKDAFGNVTYQRIFRNDPRLDTILIVKSPDGAKVMYLYGKDSGKVVRLTDETAENALEMSADDLADRANLQKPIYTNSFDEPKIKSSLPVENAAVPNQSQKEYSENYNNNFPRMTENNPQPPEQMKVENSAENQTNPPQTADNQ